MLSKVDRAVRKCKHLFSAEYLDGILLLEKVWNSLEKNVKLCSAFATWFDE